MSIFDYQSSEIDWCEHNNVVNNNICEFANTITGFCFIFLSLFGLYHLQKL